MRQFLSNLGLAAATTAEHLADDPALLMLQISRRLPAGLRRPVVESVRRVSRTDSTAIPALLAGVAAGEQQRVIGLLERSLEGISLHPKHALNLANVALVVHRPDLADSFLNIARDARGRQAVQSRTYWYGGDVTAAIDTLAGTTRRGELRQIDRLKAELQILRGWRPTLCPAPMHPEPRRVLHVLTNSLPHTVSGYAQRSHSILLAQQAAGWETMAVTRIGYPVQVGKLTAKSTEQVDGITYARLLPSRLAPTMAGRLQQQAEALKNLALQFRPTLLHTTTHFTNAAVTRAVAEALGIPWVYEVRGQLADTWAATRGPEAKHSERYKLFQAREAEAVHEADLAVTLGSAMKANIVASGVPAAKVVVAPNAVGGEYLNEPLSPREARTRLGLDPGSQYIGTVSSLVAYEGIDDLVSAFARLAPVFPNLKLLIVGDGVELPALKEQVRNTGLSARAVFTGRVPRGKAHLYHQALDVFVVPRKNLVVTRDVTPMKPVEAMACSRPIVASDLPALKEIVTDGTNGLICNPEDPVDLAAKLERLLADAHLRALFGRSGRSTALGTRTWTSNAHTVGAAYERITELN